MRSRRCPSSSAARSCSGSGRASPIARSPRSSRSPSRPSRHSSSAPGARSLRGWSSRTRCEAEAQELPSCCCTCSTSARSPRRFKTLLAGSAAVKATAAAVAVTAAATTAVRRRQDRIEATGPGSSAREDAGRQARIPGAQSALVSAPSGPARLAAGSTAEPARRPATAKPASARSNPGTALVVKHSAPLHDIPAADTPLQAAAAEQTPAASGPASTQASAPVAAPTTAPAEQPRATEGTTDSGTRNVEPVTQADASVVVPTSTAASPSKAELGSGPR